MKNNKAFKEAIDSLEKLLNNTENGIYRYDYRASLNGEIFYIKIIVKNASLYEMSYFLKELDDWKIMNNLKDHQILIEKNKGV